MASINQALIANKSRRRWQNSLDSNFILDSIFTIALSNSGCLNQLLPRNQQQAQLTLSGTGTFDLEIIRPVGNKSALQSNTFCQLNKLTSFATVPGRFSLPP